MTTKEHICIADSEGPFLNPECEMTDTTDLKFATELSELLNNADIIAITLSEHSPIAAEIMIGYSGTFESLEYTQLQTQKLSNLLFKINVKRTTDNTPKVAVELKQNTYHLTDLIRYYIVLTIGNFNSIIDFFKTIDISIFINKVLKKTRQRTDDIYPGISNLNMRATAKLQNMSYIALADDITELAKLLNSDELKISFIKELDLTGQPAFNYWLVSSEEILKQIISKLTKINIKSLTTGGDKHILKLSDKNFYIILTDENMIVLLEELKKYKKDVLFLDKTNKAINTGGMRSIKLNKFTPSGFEPSPALIVSEHLVAPTAGASTLLEQPVAQGVPKTFNLVKTPKNKYLFDPRGLHYYKNIEWFKDYFGLDEEKELMVELPEISKSFKWDIIKYTPKLSYIYAKNIIFTIKDKLYNVGDFSCLPLIALQKAREYELTQMKKTPVLEDTSQIRIKYNKRGEDIVGLINNSEPTDVFQAASQFNLLEMMNDNIQPENGISYYPDDNTQGPRVALTSPIGTFFRNYLIYQGAPQTFESQFNTLSKLLNVFGFKEVKTAPNKGEYLYKNGYCFINPTPEQSNSAQTRQDLFDEYLTVGVQWDSPLLIDYTKKLCQVYCSGLPFGHYASNYNLYLNKDDYRARIKPFAIGILKAAFKCTLQVAVNKLDTIQAGKRITVYLTPVGGGAFNNPMEWIVEALINALIDFRQYPLDIEMVLYIGGEIKPAQELLDNQFVNDCIKMKDEFKKITPEELEKKFQSYIIDQAGKRKYIKYKTKYLKLKTQLGM